MQADHHNTIKEIEPAFKGVLICGRNKNKTKILLLECVHYFDDERREVARLTHEGTKYERLRVFNPPRSWDGRQEFNQLDLMSITGEFAGV